MNSVFMPHPKSKELLKRRQSSPLSCSGHVYWQKAVNINPRYYLISAASVVSLLTPEKYRNDLTILYTYTQNFPTNIRSKGKHVQSQQKDIIVTRFPLKYKVSPALMHITFHHSTEHY